MSNQTEKAKAAFAELKEASQLIDREFEILVNCRSGGSEKATLVVLNVVMEIVVMEITALCDYSINVEYEVSSAELGRVISSGTRDYESIKRMLSYDGK